MSFGNDRSSYAFEHPGNLPGPGRVVRGRCPHQIALGLWAKVFSGRHELELSSLSRVIVTYGSGCGMSYAVLRWQITNRAKLTLRTICLQISAYGAHVIT